MFLSKASVVLLVAFFGTPWFTGDGGVSASPSPQVPAAAPPAVAASNPPQQQPVAYPQQPQVVYQQPPQVVYAQPPPATAAPAKPAFLSVWDGIHNWKQGAVQGILGLNPVTG
ncbi:uncharacterized protein LOC126910627 isoform X4 [Spodoptera frugiperda]|uniref:Uncharacterized protein LOC126910627 isoform X4 n=1 Tax=Spodoptera frugiperda TaxID=7108 RepID=A0A9R0E708_SPOFR|nr:uncharacterized protein LOC126910627 isoform X4 [Spodoptera frugiperda]